MTDRRALASGVPSIATPNGARWVVLDWMRGIVMVLMAIDHASLMFNAGRVAADSAGMWEPGQPLPLAQFLTRFVTHLCAPTFVVLAGAAAAASAGRRAALGRPRSIDTDLVIRGALLIALDVLYMSRLSGVTLLLQVLYAIGIGMILLVPLRRLPAAVVATLGVGWFVVGEWVTGWLWHPPAPVEPKWLGAVIAFYADERFAFVYPAIPWAAMMAIGWALGEWLRRARAAGRPFPARTLALVGVATLVAFVAVRGANGYGNMFLVREDGSLVQWLHVSKYPPSLAFALFELGALALCLAALAWLEPRVTVRRNGPILVFGQTALFFYLIHFPLLGGAAMALGAFQSGGLTETYLATIGVLLVAYPICRGFRRLKQAHPGSVLRYL